MKIAKRSNANDGFRSGPAGDINAANYAARAAEFIRAKGAGFVIRALEGTKGSIESKEKPTEAQWLAWMQYFSDKGIPCRFAMVAGMTTVPCEWPEMFDYTAETSDHDGYLPRPKPVITERKREEITAKFVKLSRHMATRVKSSKRFSIHELSPSMAAAHLEESAERFKSPCAPLSQFVKPLIAESA